jgi:uncharacterized protein YqjF (DUF2071 family)
MTASQSEDQQTYESKRPNRGAGHRVSFRVDKFLGPSPIGTLEHFLLERYLLFVQRQHQIYVGTVHHQPYQAHTAIIDAIHDDLIAAAGLPANASPPPLAHFCPGVDVEVFGIQRLSQGGSMDNNLTNPP